MSTSAPSPSSPSLVPGSSHPFGIGSPAVAALAPALIFGAASLRGFLADGGVVSAGALAAASVAFFALASAGWLAGRRGGRQPAPESAPCGEDRFRQLADAMPQIVWASRP